MKGSSPTIDEALDRYLGSDRPDLAGWVPDAMRWASGVSTIERPALGERLAGLGATIVRPALARAANKLRFIAMSTSAPQELLANACFMNLLELILEMGGRRGLLGQAPRIPEAVVAELVAALKDSDHGVRALAASCLGSNGIFKERVEGDLTARLQDVSSVVVLAASTTLLNMGSQGATTSSLIQHADRALSLLEPGLHQEVHQMVARLPSSNRLGREAVMIYVQAGMTLLPAAVAQH